MGKRGVHLLPAAYHGYWMERRDYWITLLKRMGVEWVVLITDGDSVIEPMFGTNPVRFLLQNGIRPIIRDSTEPLPRVYSNHENIAKVVAEYDVYGISPHVQLWNEPSDDREWGDKAPPDWFPVFMSLWADAASRLLELGAYPGFPDKPQYKFEEDENPFSCLTADMWNRGAWFSAHNYGKNRSRDYPYDMVTQYGWPLTPEGYDRLLDDYASDPAWKEEPLELINQKRAELADCGLSAIDDDVCWNGWHKILHYSSEAYGFDIPIALTEGGWCPRDRPGTGPNTDIRHPHTTPKMVAKKTLQIFERPSPFFAICPWLLADDEMCPGGYVGWPYDSWVGWAYADKYGAEKPVIDILSAPAACPLFIDGEGDLRDQAWAEEKFGFHFVTDYGEPQLIELRELSVLYAQHAVINQNGLTLDNVNMANAQQWHSSVHMGDGYVSKLCGLYTMEGEPEPEPEPPGGDVKYTLFGPEVTEEEFRAYFGDIKINGDGDYEVVELRGVTGHNSVITTVLDKNGYPVASIGVMFYYSTALERPGSGYDGRGDLGSTKANGTCDFGMYEGAWYDPKVGIGPHKVWLFGEGTSQQVEGLGMVALTQHDHIDIVFKEKGDSPPPPPPPDGIKEALENIRQDAIDIYDELDNIQDELHINVVLELNDIIAGL